MLIIDNHLDLAMNALEWNRDLRMSLKEINESEIGLSDKPGRYLSTVSFPELRKGNIGLVVATQIARYAPLSHPFAGWHSPQQAWAHTQAQLSWYKTMEEEEELVQITDTNSLDEHLRKWKMNEKEKKPIGYILSLEGADSLVNINYINRAYAYGLRAIGPAHYGPGRYANGTNASGGLPAEGKELLREMERLNIILDATHLCDESFWEALELFKGPVWASHNNCRSLVNHNRQFSDAQIVELIRRGGVIGGVLDAWMMVSGWSKGTSNPRQMNCNLEIIIDHFDHICQLAGNSLHITIGSDLDGGFGTEQCPWDLGSIADLNCLPALLKKRGYTPVDVENITHGNFLRFLRNAWK
ncbi:MAG: membrane dipeptidase [Flavisolibacter sp.]